MDVGKKSEVVYIRTIDGWMSYKEILYDLAIEDVQGNP